jgi:hypothetical protein
MTELLFILYSAKNSMNVGVCATYNRAFPVRSNLSPLSETNSEDSPSRNSDEIIDLARKAQYHAGPCGWFSAEIGSAEARSATHLFIVPTVWPTAGLRPTFIGAAFLGR